MAQKKLIRFEAIKHFENVLEYPENMAGNWHAFFHNHNPITLELACGKGEYSVGLGQIHENKNFIGVDLKGNRIWRGAKTALDKGLKNVAFLRTQIDQITDYFEKDEVEAIWITFPDPQLRKSNMKRRLTHPKFLRKYQEILKKSGVINLKTDSPDLYEFTKTVIATYGLTLLVEDDNIYSKQPVSQELSIKTHYEGLDIAGSNKIHYLCFLLDKEMPIEKDQELKDLVL